MPESATARTVQPTFPTAASPSSTSLTLLEGLGAAVESAMVRSCKSGDVQRTVQENISVATDGNGNDLVEGADPRIGLDLIRLAEWISSIVSS
jgi:hypothetical protein